MRIAVLFFAFFIFTSILFAQGETDEKNINMEGLTVSKKDPDKFKYTHVFLSYGFIVGKSGGDSSSIRYGNSSTFSIGFRSKYRLSKFYELGYEFSYHRSRYLPVQDSLKNVPDRNLNDKEMLANNALEAYIFNRFKLKNRVQSAGIFLDLGAYADWNYRTVHYVKNNIVNGLEKTTVVKNYHLNYMQNYAYGAAVRLGFNRFALEFRYRLSDFFNSTAKYSEFPNMIVALQLGLHQ